MSLSEDEVERLRDAVRMQTGVRLQPRDDSRLAHALEKVRSQREPHVAGSQLVGGSRADECALIEALAGELTVKETYFFRAPRQFRLLRDLVSSEVAKARMDVRRPADKRRFAVWSAGCSTGEEAYSIAMTLLCALRTPGSWELDILGTDLSEEAVRVAREGTYVSPRVAPDFVEAARLMERYCTTEGDTLTVSERLREVTRFEVGNILAAQPRDLDVVFCRNVMIYFPLAEQPALVASLLHALRPGGWLFTGDAELLHVMEHGFESVRLDGAVVYRKPGGAPLPMEGVA